MKKKLDDNPKTAVAYVQPGSPGTLYDLAGARVWL